MDRPDASRKPLWIAAETLHVQCPECSTWLPFYRSPAVGRLVTCGRCGEILVVAADAPLRLDWASEAPT